MVASGHQYELGERVVVRQDPDEGPGPWPAQPTGTIAEHPLADDGGFWRPTDTTTGPARFYWVVFDEPQMDAEGDGPYFESEVLDIYLDRAGTT
jgi:hypothetical protein